MKLIYLVLILEIIIVTSQSPKPYASQMNIKSGHV